MKNSSINPMGHEHKNNPDIITADECAFRLKVTRRALCNWPWLPRIKIGKSVRYIWPDVITTLKRRGCYTETREVNHV